MGGTGVSPQKFPFFGLNLNVTSLPSEASAWVEVAMGSPTAFDDSFDVDDEDDDDDDDDDDEFKAGAPDAVVDGRAGS